MPDPPRPAPEPESPPVYSADKVRGGEIILKTPVQKWVFLGGLAGAVLLVLIFALVA